MSRNPLPHTVSFNSSLTIIHTHPSPGFRLGVLWVKKSCIWSPIQRPPRFKASAAPPVAWALKRGGASISISCSSAFLLVSYPTSWWYRPSPSSIYSFLRCSYPGSREGGFTDTLSMGEESWWVRGQEAISSTSILWLSSICGDLSFGIKRRLPRKACYRGTASIL